MRNRGKHLEMLVEKANIHYYFQDLAWIEQQEVQKKMIRGKLVYTKKAAPDFMGTVQGGRSVAFDCKTTEQKSFPLKNILERPHQMQQLAKQKNLGGIAFYLIEFKTENRYFVLTIPELEKAIESMENGGRKSIPLADLKHEVKASRLNCLDYLQPFLKQRGEAYAKQPSVF